MNWFPKFPNLSPMRAVGETILDFSRQIVVDGRYIFTFKLYVRWDKIMAKNTRQYKLTKKASISGAFGKFEQGDVIEGDLYDSLPERVRAWFEEVKKEAGEKGSGGAGAKEGSDLEEELAVYEAYAEKIGKPIGQLTEEDLKAALSQDKEHPPNPLQSGNKKKEPSKKPARGGK